MKEGVIVIDWKAEAFKKKKEMIEDLTQLIAIPSVLDEEQATLTEPFGPYPKKALEWLLQEGEKAGFNIHNCDHRAGHIEMGAGEDLVGILCHVDVVPPGNGWTDDPFNAVIRDGKLFGRGAIDDKGPTIAAWHAMKLVKESGVPLRRRVRLIVGTDEESGFRCVNHYFSKEEMPTVAFAPDADFPIIHAEKGIATLIFSQRAATQRGQLLNFQAGMRTNMVPAEAVAVVVNTSASEEQFQAFLTAMQTTGTFQKENDRVTITIHGKSAHAMEPDAGINAAVLLARFLQPYLLEGVDKQFVDFIVSSFGKNSRGDELGLDFSDHVSGETTLNPGVLRFSPTNGGEIRVSLRYSVHYPFEEKMTACMQCLQGTSFSLDVASNSLPHYVEGNDPFIKLLQQVYTEHTGEQAALLSIGGGTYARVLKKGVAFGMLFPGREDVAHQADEYVYIEDLIRATAIYADTLFRLCTTDSNGGF